MANWCNNVVWFEAEPTTMQKIKKMFLQMAKKQKATREGQLPPFIKDKRDWLFAIRWEAEDVLYYETRWSPNIDVLIAIAEHYKVGFTIDYEELGWLIYGRASFTDGVLTNTYLEDADFEAFRFDAETDRYHFEGVIYDSVFEILDTLLERKIALNKK